MKKGWIIGPKELLDHAWEHIITKSDFDKRIAFISIDNAVELSILTYLSLPRRIIKRNVPSKREIGEAENSFSSLLDLLEKYNNELSDIVFFEDIEWYHRIRNQLYHNGNCITIDASQVESYCETAITLFEVLFNEKYKPKRAVSYTTYVANFLLRWKDFDQLFRSRLPPKEDNYAYYWKRDYLSSIDENLKEDYETIFNFRNEISHSTTVYTEEEFESIYLTFDRLEKALNKQPSNGLNVNGNIS
ncbi:MAG TPA: hypothetical protein VN538_05220 [Clostridia bacterium]|nr:hypothetical protein [Clostridia bacterium]